MAAPSTIHVLRRFVRALATASPSRATETVLLTLCLGLVEGVSLLLLIPLLQLVGVDAQQGSLGQVIGYVRQAFAAVGLVPTLPTVLALYVVIVAAQSGLQRRQASVRALLQEDIVHALRTRLYRAIAKTTWVYFSRSRASYFMQLLTDKVDRVASAAYYLLDLLVTAGISAAYVVLAFRVSATMTSFVVACGGLLALAMRPRLSRARRAGQDYSDASTRLYTATSDHLDSMKMAKGYGAEGRHAEHFAQLSQELGSVARVAVEAAAQARQWLTVGSALLLAIIVYVSHGVAGMSAASLLLLILLFARLMPRLTSLYEKAQALTLELPTFELVLAAEDACLQAAEPVALRHRAIAFERAIECQHVTFSYQETGEPTVIKDLTLSVAARSTTAIVGSSGAGKSTIADLLMGLIAPSAGAILVDGVPLEPDRFESWRSQIGYVSQDTFLFHDTVKANLIWANPIVTDEDVWQALTLASAADFVRGLPRGLDTIVGDRGLLVSGGERQRLSLARALLRRPRLLILDEATSSLDSENERRIQQAIDELHEQVTIIVITHRLSMIRNADVIHVIERGGVVESGSWNYLVARESGRFRELCRAQGIEPEPSIRRSVIERRVEIVLP